MQVASEDTLPDHLQGTRDGARILRISSEIGWIPNKSILMKHWGNDGNKVSPDDRKLRSRIRKIAGIRADAQAETSGRKDLLNEKEVRNRLGISRKQFDKWYCAGRFQDCMARPIAKNHLSAREKVFDPSLVAALSVKIETWQQEGVLAARKKEQDNKDRRSDLRRRLNLCDPADAYPLAREMNRKIVFHSGPTNAGKTYSAMQRLMSARSGTYAGPLRLLAMEAYDTMVREGVTGGLLTGEEEIDAKDASHIACTTETLSLTRPVDVVVIDEIQLLSDEDRGAAWTRALLGAPAREIHLTGAPEALPWIEFVLQATGESLEIRTYERRSDLLLQDTPARTFQGGDAIVVFSRREVMRMRASLRERGYSVAVIYGALPPEVRRQQAKLFSSGTCDILVATDAIGMGLNLPIRRVIFGALNKFDGQNMRLLTCSEIRQIGGRAGRGAGDPGYIGVVPGLSTDLLSTALKTPPVKSARPYALIRPDLQAMRPKPGKWRQLVADIRACARDLPKGWYLDLGACVDIAAQMADAHETGGGDDASFCLSAPMDADIDATSTRAVANGMSRLRKTGTWPVPSPPESLPETERTLIAWCDYGRRLEIARWFARRSLPGQINLTALDKMWEIYADRLSRALSSDAEFERTCALCNTRLTWAHRHQMCDSCFFSGDRYDDYW